jgi:glycerol kinase
MLKSTYGTGCFALLNTGRDAIASSHRLLTTVAYRLNGEVTYCLEGSIFVAGAAVQWLRDSLRVFAHAADTEALAQQVADTGGVYLVPAFVGLGAPYWDPDARGAVFGLSRASGIPEIARAVLESVGYQTRDLMAAMDADLAGGAIRPQAVRVDGGMVGNDWLCQFLADILALPVERSAVTETTALGAAYLAGLEVGLYPSLDAIAGQWQSQRRFEPTMDQKRRDDLYAGWRDAVRRTLSAT